MSLSAVLTALNEYVGDALVNDCGRPAPRVLRYHGVMPHDCCTDDGFLVTSWERGRAKEPCSGPRTVELLVRYVVCWPVPNVNQNGVVLVDDKWDAQAAMLADVAECVASTLTRLQCVGDEGDPLAVELLNLVGRDSFKFVEYVPIPALGGCAGVLWRATATPRNQAVVS